MSTTGDRHPRINLQVLPRSPVWTDRRLLLISHNQFACSMSLPETHEQWLAARQRVQERILLSAGLLPFPGRPKLHPEIWGHMTLDGCHIAKVRFESRPGIHVTGNLYLPERGTAPFPGILCPHGHWPNGRVHHDDRGSIPARCLMFAKLGFAVFSYDMIGYNDSSDVAHTWPNELVREAALYGISTFGLQLWNSIRAADFLSSLPEVDPNRLGCTGASGGASQTWNLAAVDERIRVIAPVCMLSSHFQGGCSCEEGPLLRITGLTSGDILAAIAPRPVFLPSVTGDWTYLNPQYEVPRLKRLYEMLGVPEHLGTVHFDDVHNYNQRTREYVYAWFVRWLLDDRNTGRRIPEAVLSLPAVEELRHTRNGHTSDLKQTKKTLSKLYEECLGRTTVPPASANQLRRLRSTFRPLLKWTLNVDPNPRDVAVRVTFGSTSLSGMTVAGRVYSRRDIGDVIPAFLVRTQQSSSGKAITLALMPGGKRDLFSEGCPGDTLKCWLETDEKILVPDLLGTGDTADMLKFSPRDAGDPLDIAFNNSTFAMQVQDVLTLISACREEGFTAITLRACGSAARVALLAVPFAGKMVRIELDLSDIHDTPEEWLQSACHPLMLSLGGLRTALAFTPPALLDIRHCDSELAEWVTSVYALSGCPEKLTVERKTVQP